MPSSSITSRELQLAYENALQVYSEKDAGKLIFHVDDRLMRDLARSVAEMLGAIDNDEELPKHCFDRIPAYVNGHMESPILKLGFALNVLLKKMWDERNPSETRSRKKSTSSEEWKMEEEDDKAENESAHFEENQNMEAGGHEGDEAMEEEPIAEKIEMQTDDEAPIAAGTGNHENADETEAGSSTATDRRDAIRERLEALKTPPESPVIDDQNDDNAPIDHALNDSTAVIIDEPVRTRAQRKSAQGFSTTPSVSGTQRPIEDVNPAAPIDPVVNDSTTALNEEPVRTRAQRKNTKGISKSTAAVRQIIPMVAPAASVAGVSGLSVPLFDNTQALHVKPEPAEPSDIAEMPGSSSGSGTIAPVAATTPAQPAAVDQQPTTSRQQDPTAQPAAVVPSFATSDTVDPQQPQPLLIKEPALRVKPEPVEAPEEQPGTSQGSRSVGSGDPAGPSRPARILTPGDIASINNIKAEPPILTPIEEPIVDVFCPSTGTSRPIGSEQTPSVARKVRIGDGSRKRDHDIIVQGRHCYLCGEVAFNYCPTPLEPEKRRQFLASIITDSGQHCARVANLMSHTQVVFFCASHIRPGPPPVKKSKATDEPYEAKHCFICNDSNLDLIETPAEGVSRHMFLNRIVILSAKNGERIENLKSSSGRAYFCKKHIAPARPAPFIVQSDPSISPHLVGILNATAIDAGGNVHGNPTNNVTFGQACCFICGDSSSELMQAPTEPASRHSFLSRMATVMVGHRARIEELKSTPGPAYFCKKHSIPARPPAIVVPYDPTKSPYLSGTSSTRAMNEDGVHSTANDAPPRPRCFICQNGNSVLIGTPADSAARIKFLDCIVTLSGTTRARIEGLKSTSGMAYFCQDHVAPHLRIAAPDAPQQSQHSPMQQLPGPSTSNTMQAGNDMDNVCCFICKERGSDMIGTPANIATRTAFLNRMLPPSRENRALIEQLNFAPGYVCFCKKHIAPNAAPGAHNTPQYSTGAGPSTSNAMRRASGAVMQTSSSSQRVPRRDTLPPRLMPMAPNYPQSAAVAGPSTSNVASNVNANQAPTQAAPQVFCFICKDFASKMVGTPGDVASRTSFLHNMVIKSDEIRARIEELPARDGRTYLCLKHIVPHARPALTLMSTQRGTPNGPIPAGPMPTQHAPTAGPQFAAFPGPSTSNPNNYPYASNIAPNAAFPLPNQVQYRMCDLCEQRSDAYQMSPTGNRAVIAAFFQSLVGLTPNQQEIVNYIIGNNLAATVCSAHFRQFPPPQPPSNPQYRPY